MNRFVRGWVSGLVGGLEPPTVYRNALLHVFSRIPPLMQPETRYITIYPLKHTINQNIPSLTPSLQKHNSPLSFSAYQ